jgi:pimeloyl-ACP methyl ester carboxylesterase
MPTIRANGIDIAYMAEGAGPPIVLLHGATSSAETDWGAQRPAMRRVFRLHMPDARGHGGTRWDAADGWSAEMLVDDLAAFADALELPTFHLLGFSMGAHTALRYATRHPERLRTLLISGIDVQRQPRLNVARYLMDPERIDRSDPGWAAALNVPGPVGTGRQILASSPRSPCSLITPEEPSRDDAALLVVGSRRLVPTDPPYFTASARWPAVRRATATPGQPAGRHLQPGRETFCRDRDRGSTREKGRPSRRGLPASSTVPTSMGDMASDALVRRRGRRRRH